MFLSRFTYTHSAETAASLEEGFIKELHRIVIVRSRGRRGSQSQYRTNECPVVDTVTRRIDYQLSSTWANLLKIAEVAQKNSGSESDFK